MDSIKKMLRRFFSGSFFGGHQEITDDLMLGSFILWLAL